MIHNAIRMIMSDATGCVINVHDGIHDRAGLGFWIRNNIADRVGCRVKKGFDVWLYRNINGIVLHNFSF